MLEKAKQFIGRKLTSIILGPILSAIFVAVNAMLPEGARLTPDQITSVVEWIFGSITAFVVMQGTHDAVKGSSTAGTASTPPTPTPSVPDKVEGFASGIHPENVKR